MNEQFDRVLKRLDFTNVQYSGTHEFFDGTKHVYFVGEIAGTTYEIDIKMVAPDKIEIWDKTWFEKDVNYLAEAKKGSRGWQFSG
ncbi:hypothetical protein [Peribacillus glennii]|uniref:Uncharacterized protein n=1 Tax=Peribacillus glennii TaxID=2303991 RepID=A0A372L8U9_9BACI|nr:hypothetical protein [Peribacillus glennii]RFU60869.1 hypothetical protein D0466_20015 [Peribacillus glennii]